MATYKEIFGTTVKNFTSDPDNVETGQVWYNTSLNSLRTTGIAGSTGIWVSGNELNNGRNEGNGSGTQDAALVWSGTSAPNGSKSHTESYNGTTWTEVADMGTGGSHRHPSNHGPQTSTLGISGREPNGSNHNLVEQWNGTSWTEISDVATSRTKTSGVGTVTSALVMAGPGAPTTSPNDHKFVESWNGSSWSEIADTIHNGGATGAGGVSNTSAVVFGGGPGPQIRTEIWNGSTWTEVNNMNVPKFQLPSHGIATAALRIGGRTPDSGDDTCESWNGTTWSSIANLNSLANFAAGAGTSSLGLRAMGPGGDNLAVSEEFYGSGQAYNKNLE